ncbi:MAG: protein translocase subunit SecD [Alphaproteobacteria bacterium]|nr:protein translocase subunit SecD [Pseudomonadota bacterium]TDI66254.1 MAG: protein translocase subunit SecD [Alphaproteobacteria bacterium]
MIHFSRWKIILILGLCSLGLVLAAPNLFSKEQLAGFPAWVPKSTLNLGLDLRGGSHLLLEVDLRSAFKERLANLVQAIRAELRSERIGYSRIGATRDQALVVIRDPDKKARRGRGGQTNIERAAKLLRRLEAGTEVDVSGARITVSYTVEARRERDSQVLQQSIEIVRRRVDEFGTTEPSIQSQGSNRILVQVPGLDDPERLKKVLGQTAKMTFHLLDERFGFGTPLPTVAPPGSFFAKQRPDKRQDLQGGPPGRVYVLKKRVVVSGEHLVDSQPSFDTGRPVVSFRFNTIGARKFGRVTQENVGKPFAILLDNEVISAPVIQGPILGGSGIITGGFTVSETQDLALLLRAGALPAPMTILEERTVGPDLGADSIAAGQIACIIGFILVLVFMVMAYGIFGVFANIALVLNMALLLGGLSLLQATLTLPGIAGIVLTIGMAVDANVLVFERIREEVASGRTPLSSVDAGYRRALTTIIDANLTTLIAAIILFEFGSGPVKGFAVTLSIGLVTSMFTAIMVTRLIVVTYLRLRRLQTLPI